MRTQSLGWFMCLFAGGIVSATTVMIGYGSASDKPDQADQGYAEAMFQISSRTGSLLTGEQFLDEEVFQRLCRSQAAILKASFVLQAALRNPEAADLAIVKSHDPGKIGWLADGLSVRFPEQGEYMVLKLRLADTTPEETIKLLDAVVKAYEEEVIFTSRGKELARREVLDKAYNRLNQQLTHATNSYLLLAKDPNSASNGDDLFVQLLVDKIKLYERERLGLQRRMMETVAKDPSLGQRQSPESERSHDGDPPMEPAENVSEINSEKLKYDVYTHRLQQLEQEIEMLEETLREETLRERTEISTDLQVKQREINQLTAVLLKVMEARDMVALDMSQPDRIRLIQEATWRESGKQEKLDPKQ